MIKMPSAEVWAVEIKYGVAPKLGKHFSRSCDDIGATHKYVVYGGSDQFGVKNGVTVISLKRLMEKIALRNP